MAMRALISAACLLVAAEAASQRSHSSSAVSIVLHSQGPNKVDTKTLVASLTEVSKGLSAEDDKSKAMASAFQTECKKTDRNLKLSLAAGKRAFDMATADYDKTNAQVNALEASLAELKGQIDGSNKELDTLQAKLKKMRKDKGLLKKGASAALRQIEAVIAKTYLRESNEHQKGPSALEKKASTLEQLSESLSFLQTDAAWGDDDAEDTEKHEVVKAQKSKPVMLLKSDKQAVVRASQATQKGFNEEEKTVLDLIDVERKKLQDLEDNLQDLQPAISNKLKQAMEINRTLDAASRGMERDTELMAAEKKKCDLVDKRIGEQGAKRRNVINDCSMGAKVLQAMDTFLFLSKDLVGLTKNAAPSLLQVASHAIHESVVAPLSFMQEGESSESEMGMGLEQMVENYGASGVVQEGPFDGVTKMIEGLIASLKAQANEEVNQHQFCQDSLSKNRRDRIAKKNNIDTLTSTIRWSKMAIVRLDDDQKYLEGEIKRLGEAQANEKKELETETKRINKEHAEHKLGDEVITKAIVILSQLCDLKGAALLQQGSQRTTKVGSRFNQCKEASELLKSASKALKELDKMTKDYMGEYKKVSTSIESDAKKAGEARTTELKSTKAAGAERASELATAQKDVREGEKELKLIDDAKSELEHQCSHVETREEKMARRKEEIDALKEALQVLSGEAIPA